MKPAFISDDGRIFDTEEACIEYERFAEQKHDVLAKVIQKAISCDMRFPECPPVAELIFIFIDFIKARGIELTEKNQADSESPLEGGKSEEIRELLDFLADFIMRIYVRSYIELKSEDDVDRIAQDFYNWFDEFA
jgi:hypothetical protein